MPRPRESGSRSPVGPASGRARWRPPVPTARGWGLLVLAAGLVGAWRLLGLREIRDLAVLLAAVVVVSGVALAVEAAWAGLHLDARTTVATPVPGEDLRVLVALSHRLPFTLPVTLVWAPDPGGGLSVAGRAHDEGVAHASVRSPLDVPAGRGTWRTITLVARARGASGVAFSGVVLADALGLARCRLPVGTHVDVVVLPALVSAPEVGDVVGDLGGASVVGGAGEPGGNLRDHRDGDPLRLIHWKQTARQGRLLVNVPEAPAGAHHRIHLVTDPGAHTPDSFETAVSVVATLVVRALGHGEEVDLGTGPRGGEARPARGEALVMRRLALVGTGETVGGTGMEPPAPHLHGLVVTGRATPSLLADLEGAGGGTVVLTGTDPAELGDLPACEGWRWRVLGGGDP